MKSHQFVPFLSGISAIDSTFSRDGRWVAYTSYPDHTLWRSRDYGIERMQLTYPPIEVGFPFISPVGTTSCTSPITAHQVIVNTLCQAADSGWTFPV